MPAASQQHGGEPTNVDDQWRSQNAEKVTHIKGRLLEQAVILVNFVPFQIRNFS